MNPDPSAPRVFFTYPVDQTLRKLKVSNKLKPYLERNRIVELFSNLTREILTNKPKDVLKFVRNELVATQGNFVPQVILLGPPNVNVPALAEYVSRQMNIVHIKLEDVFTAHDDQRNRGTVSSVSQYNKHSTDPESKNMFNNDQEKVLDCKALAQTLLELLSNSNSNGWILTGFPRDDMDAQCLNRHKILPTHVVSLVSNDNQPTCSSTGMQNYKSKLFGIRRFYSYFLREINVCDRSTSKLGGIIVECVQVPLNKLYRPVSPRVVLFGPRGSGKRSLGQKLEENIHIIHFDMTQRLSNKSVGSQNKKCEELLVRLGENDCQTLGYVLTGFPRNVDELRMLDQCDNPPNRIIFLTLSDDICLKRHGERCFDMNTCREMRKAEVYDTGHSQCINMNRMIVTHPDDEIEQIKADLQAYRYVEQDMIKYTGKNAIFIDANTCSVNILYERVVSAIQRPPLVSQDKTCEPATSSNVSQNSLETNDNMRQQDAPQCDANKWKFTMKFTCSNRESKSCDLEQIKRILRDE
uniref:Adenylate kinase 8 n=2 Tax=Cacopsylla melanoneura TaxID=428564 RepID=A0A8D8TLE9_9HEMI